MASRPKLGLNERPCEGCGEVFKPTDARARYCSLSCRTVKYWPPPQKPCETCGTTMVKPTQGMSMDAWTARRFCSKLCMGDSYKNPRVACPNCGTEFHPVITRATVYCSRECYHAYRRGKAQSPEWRLAPMRKRAALGANFTPSQKKQLLLLAGRACELCGATEHLEVDHILAVALGGTNDMNNGQVLCRSCHKDKTDTDLGRAASIA